MEITTIFISNKFKNSVDRHAGVSKQIGRLLQFTLLKQLLKICTDVVLQQPTQSIGWHVQTGGAAKHERQSMPAISIAIKRCFILYFVFIATS